MGEGSPTLTKDGTLYFLTHYEGVRGNYGIYRSKQINGKYTKPEPLPKTINSSHYDWTPFISPDESYLIFASGRKGSYGFNDLYISFNKGNNNWTKPKNMGPAINDGSQVRFPAVSPDGKYLFFNRSTREKHDDVFWIDAKIIDKFKTR
jgi:Tol biopolymer transport system component